MEIPGTLFCTLVPAIIGAAVIIYFCLRMAGLISQDERKRGHDA